MARSVLSSELAAGVGYDFDDAMAGLFLAAFSMKYAARVLVPVSFADDVLLLIVDDFGLVVAVTAPPSSSNRPDSIAV